MIRPFKCDDGKWGYKDNENNFIIPPTYNCAMPYDDGICWVKYLNWGCINLKEEILVPFIYQTVERLDPNVYKVRGLNGKYGIIDQHGNFILDTLFDNIIKECDDVLEIKSGDKKFYTDYKGVKLFENIDIEYICKLGHYTVAVTESSCIFLSKENIIEIPTQDGYMLLFNLRLNNKYIVSNRYDEQKVVVYNNKGEKIFSHNDDEGYHFCNEPLCEDILILKTKQGICLHNLITQEEKTFVSIKDFIKLNDQYIVTISSDEEKRWGIITSEGETVIPNIYAGIGTNFGNNNISGSYFDGKYIAASKDGETCGIIDMNQNIVVPFVYTRIENCADDLNGLLIARKDGNYGVINLKNEVVVDFVYSNIGHFYYGVAIAKKEGKYGAIDIKGNVVIPFEYEKINDFRECKYTIAKKHNSYISYDIYGNITINNSNNTLCSFNGLLKIDNKSTNWYYNSRGTMSNNLSGYCDWYGNEVISCNRIIEQEKSYILLSDNFKIPILNAWDESKVDIESVISQTNYYQLEKIETEH